MDNSAARTAITGRKISDHTNTIGLRHATCF
jgi:hypothetical protein